MRPQRVAPRHGLPSSHGMASLSALSGTPSSSGELSLSGPAPAGAQELDGGVLEGGGQILRNAAALSAALGRPVAVRNVRAGRATPGLRAQHLAGLEAVAAACAGELRDARGERPEVGSTSFALRPGRVTTSRHVADTGTAGSCTLICQAVLPVLLLAAPSEERPASELVCRGGTDAEMAPPVDFLRFVLLPTLRRHVLPAVVQLEMAVLRRGFYPRGGGEMLLTVSPLAAGHGLRPFLLEERGEVVRVTAYPWSCGGGGGGGGGRGGGREGGREGGRGGRRGDRGVRVGRDDRGGRDDGAGAQLTPEEAMHEMVRQVRAVLRKYPALADHMSASEAAASGGRPFFSAEPQAAPATGHSCGVLVVAETDTGCLLSGSARVERDVPFQEVGERAAQELVAALQHGGCVDEYLQDQLIIFAALAEGTSRLLAGPLSLHTETAIHVASQLTGAVFQVSRRDDGMALVSCQGIGARRALP